MKRARVAVHLQPWPAGARFVGRPVLNLNMARLKAGLLETADGEKVCVSEIAATFPDRLPLYAPVRYNGHRTGREMAKEEA